MLACLAGGMALLFTQGGRAQPRGDFGAIGASGQIETAYGERVMPRRRPEPVVPAGKAPEVVITRNLGFMFDPLDREGSRARLEALLDKLDYQAGRDAWIDFGNFSAPWLQPVDRNERWSLTAGIEDSAALGLLPDMRELGCRATILAEQELLLSPAIYRWNDIESGYFSSSAMLAVADVPVAAPHPVAIDAFGLKLGMTGNVGEVMVANAVRSLLDDIPLSQYDPMLAHFLNNEKRAMPNDLIPYLKGEKIDYLFDHRDFGPSAYRYTLGSKQFLPNPNEWERRSSRRWVLSNAGIAWEYDPEISPTFIKVTFDSFQQFNIRSFSPQELGPLKPAPVGEGGAGREATTEPRGALHVAHYALKVWGEGPKALLLRIAPVGTRPEDKQGVIIHRIWSGQFRVRTEEQFRVGSLRFTPAESYRLFGETIRREVFVRKVEQQYPALIPHFAPIEAVMRRMDQIADDFKNSE